MSSNSVASVFASDSSRVHIGNNNYLHQDTKDRDCIGALYETDPLRDRQQIIDTKGGLLPGASDWILTNDNFTRWREGEECFLWIKGDAGKGKTMLICAIIENLEHDDRNHVSYFFCQAGVPTTDNATSVLRGLVYGLVRYHPHNATVLSHVRKEFDSISERMFEGPNLWQIIRKILVTILKDPLMNHTVFVIDALDECEGNQAELLKFIVETNTQLGIKWLVSSRKDPVIENRLRGIANSEKRLTIDLELNEHLTSGAVKNLIGARLRDMMWWDNCGDELRDIIKHKLKQKSGNTFLWVAMVCQELNDCTATQALGALEQFPPGLDELYKRMVDKITASKSATQCKEIMAVVSASYRPLNLKELAIATNSLSQFQNNTAALTQTVLSCCSFLTLRNGTTTVVFVHQSAREFIMNKAHEEIMPDGILEQHNKMFHASWKAMKEAMRHFINPGNEINWNFPDGDHLEPLAYACTYWVTHLKDCGGRKEQRQQFDAEIEIFLHEHLLHWLQTLGELRSMPEGILSMHNLVSILSATHVAGLYELVEDARRVALFFGNAIEADPLQIYASALLFSPVNSLVRNRFLTKGPSWLTRIPVIEEDWGSCVQVLEGQKSEITALAFSSDDLFIASGFRDGTIKVWNSTTGVCLEEHCIEGSSVESIVFTEGQEYLSSVSSYDSDTIQVWEPAKQILRTMASSDDCDPESLVLSPDAKWLASGTDGPVIKIWEVQTGTLIRNCPCADYDVVKISFAADSKRLISGSAQCGTVTIWNTTTWTVERTFQDHADSISSIACAAKTQLFVSSSYSGEVCVRDFTSKDSKMKISTSDRSVGNIAISGDGTRIAAERGKRELWVWDVSSRRHTHTLNSTEGYGITLALSSKGSRLISGWENIEIWDITNGSHAKERPSHTNSITSVALSTDIQWAASGSWDNNIKIWDMETLSCKHTLVGHTYTIESILFLDDNRLGSASIDCAVIVWNFQTGARLHTLIGHTASVSSLVFLPESDLLISGSRDGTIRTWNIDTDHHDNHSFQFSSKGAPSITLSPCRLTLVSISFNGEIDFWDLQSWERKHFLSMGGKNLESVAISPNGQWVAVSHYTSYNGGTLEVLHVPTGLRNHSKKLKLRIGDLSFDSNGTDLKTNVGVFSLSLVDVKGQQEGEQEIRMRRLGYGISSDKTWILKDEQKILWIPEKYRPNVSAMSGSTLLLGSDSGQIQRIAFSTEDGNSSGDLTMASSKCRRGSTTLPTSLSKRPRYSGQ
ncbi:hypothetical protein FGSG_10601 [Fusarium graminearum PH-1]|uniref:Chromosome 1, complete genome n=1 Tax=Gibberella zeae (strain ATCC MYA-4620 / CBS 123657 / FGSC 9075 / NRRL 31084 / PH-1) TaxID=229533 RepID=I1S1J6_GIBZE|nr:hypothetical protein FGSG_10601 [Fusarium graminearum PH-1]ESU17342.1 hypothetical protein FGSG_10601 [Fusarium graminearum PH-1]CEF76054.1 unnamed protein product [Fusarium graminearum]|eukprot:XP_011319604.1 hypothetical protein FGSG_10601 [Fusarium graminearum PH-1]